MTSFKKLTVKGATVLALVAILAAGSAPAQANPSVNFSFSFGNGGFFNHQPSFPQPRSCFTNRQISSSLRNQGYGNVQYVGETYSGYPQFQAVSGRWLYSLQVNRCSGQVYSSDRVRQVYYQPAPPTPRPSQPWWFNSQPRPFGGNSDIIYHRN